MRRLAARFWAWLDGADVLDRGAGAAVDALRVGPVVLQGRIVKLGKKTPLRVERWIPRALIGGEKARELAWKPRPALRTTSDHHCIGAGRAKCRDRILFAGADIAVDLTTGMETASSTARTAAQSERPL